MNNSMIPMGDDFVILILYHSQSIYQSIIPLQERAQKLFQHYVQRWAKDYLRRRLDWIVEDVYGRTEYSSNTNPRHLRSALCPCQVN